MKLLERTWLGSRMVANEEFLTQRKTNKKSPEANSETITLSKDAIIFENDDN